MSKTKEKAGGTRRSLRVEIVGMSCLICICVAAVIGVFSATNMKKILSANTQRELITLSEQVAGRVTASLDEDFSYLQALATNDKVYGFGQDEKAQKQYLLELAKERGVGDIGVANKSGKRLQRICQPMRMCRSAPISRVRWRG